jgi:hypothetical protein
VNREFYSLILCVPGAEWVLLSRTISPDPATDAGNAGFSQKTRTLAAGANDLIRGTQDAETRVWWEFFANVISGLHCFLA